MNFGHGSERLRASDDDRVFARPPTSTEPTEELINTLLTHLNAQFYSEGNPKRFFQDQRQLVGVLTWPATWLNQRGITLPLDRYEKILREIIAGIQRHGDTGKIKHFPAYFEHTVKQWFVHNGESLYEELKSIRNVLDLRFLKGLTPEVPKGPNPIDVLAQANRVLAVQKRNRKVTSDDADQLSFL